MELRIDRQALVPLVQQIVDALAGWLRQSEVSPGTRLPSVRQIARDNLLSQSSVVEACERLVAQGVLASRQGSGFFVADPALAARRQRDYPWFEGAAVRARGVFGELKLGCGGLPVSWRETDDLGYAIRQVSRTDMAGLFNYSTPLGLPALRQQILKRLQAAGYRRAGQPDPDHGGRQPGARPDCAHLVQAGGVRGGGESRLLDAVRAAQAARRPHDRGAANAARAGYRSARGAAAASTGPVQCSSTASITIQPAAA